jgi:hypothetical protein
MQRLVLRCSELPEHFIGFEKLDDLWFLEKSEEDE